MFSFTLSRYKIFVVLIIVVLLWQSVKYFPSFHTKKMPDLIYESGSYGMLKPVAVSVYYEALCPDSKNFFVKQLKPSVDKASRLFNLTLIPYGKAKTEESSNGSLVFTCQHGPTECLANKIHACGIWKIPDQILQVSYITCMISDNMVPELIGEKCAKDMKLDWQPIQQCANSEKGSLLLEKYGIISEILHPKMSFVPTVLLNNKYYNQAAILKDFFSQVCKIFKETPEECLSYS